jgi:hypothetical protein
MFGLVIGFTHHLQIVTISNYNALDNSCIRLLTIACTKSSHFVFTSRFLITDSKNVLCLDPYWLANTWQLRKLNLSLSLILRPTVSRLVCLGIKHPFGTYDQIFITVRQLRVCWCWALSLTRGRVCRVQLLLVLASTIMFGPESRGTTAPILLSQIRDFPFRRLLRLAGLRWRYSASPPNCLNSSLGRGRVDNTAPHCSSFFAVATCLFAKPLLRNGCSILAYSAVVA